MFSGFYYAIKRGENVFNFIKKMALGISKWGLQGVYGQMQDKQFLEQEIAKWKGSPQRLMQIKGQLYYQNEHDILIRERTVIGEGGELQAVNNLPNNLVIDNQYGKLVNQKANYLLGQPFVLECENKRYLELLKNIFNKRFMKMLKNGCKAALNNGIAWLYPYYDETGEFSFRLFPGYEILPFWRDSEHTILDCAVRLYLVEGYEGTTPTVIEKVEVYDFNGIHNFILDGGSLVPDTMTYESPDLHYVTTDNGTGTVQGFNWAKIPLIPLKYNEQEIPLIKKVKSLQDGINVMLSDFENNMQEDPRNTILILKNYCGTNLEEFRKNLATYGVVNIQDDGEIKGDVKTLEITVNAENYKAILEIFKKALIENAMGYDAKNDKLYGGNPNQMNIQSMYSDIDLDANDMETELQAAFEEILWFVNAHLANTGNGSFDNEEVTVIFNRDILINESEAVANCQASVGILSDETIVGQHPWVDDPQKELERLEKQREKEEMLEQQYNPFNESSQSENGDVDEE